MLSPGIKHIRQMMMMVPGLICFTLLGSERRVREGEGLGRRHRGAAAPLTSLRQRQCDAPIPLNPCLADRGFSFQFTADGRAKSDAASRFIR